MGKNRIKFKKKEGRKSPRFYLSKDKKLISRRVRRKLKGITDVDGNAVIKKVRSEFEDIY